MFILKPYLDLEARSSGLAEARDLALEELDLLLRADPERDRLEPAGEADFRDPFEALEDFLDRAEWLDLGDSLAALFDAGDLEFCRIVLVRDYECYA